jgi:hypothetical protein
MSAKTRGQRLILIENARSVGKAFRFYLAFLGSTSLVVLVGVLLPWLRVRWFVGGMGLGSASW